MICRRCGARVPDELPICGSCGLDLARALAAPRPARPTVRSTPEPEDDDDEELDEPPARQMLSGPRGSPLRGPASGAYVEGDVVAGHYFVESCLGEGPISVVYAALDQELGLPVALKVMAPEIVRSPAQVHRFITEMERTAELSHENLVRVFEVFEDGGRCIVSAQRASGRRLADVLAERLPQGLAAPNHEIRAILTELGEALTVAHPGLAHGALKPGNVFVAPAGIKVTDLGLTLAVPRDAYLAGHRQRQQPVRHLAPEVVAGGAFDHRADLYSLGVIAFELITGLPLPAAAAERSRALVDVPAGAAEVFAAVLSPDPGRRPTDVDEVVEVLLTAAAATTNPRRTGAPRAGRPAAAAPVAQAVDEPVEELEEELEEELDEIDIEDAEIEEVGGDEERTDPRAHLPPAASGQGAVRVAEAVARLDFEASITSAMEGARATARAPQKQRRPKRPGDEPDASAMKNRPVAAAGEMKVITRQVPIIETAAAEPAVQVGAQAPAPAAPAAAPPRRDGTAQISIPKELRPRLPSWLILLLAAAVGATVLTLGIIVRHVTKDPRPARRSPAETTPAADAGTGAGVGTTPLVVKKPGGPEPGAVEPWEGACPRRAVRVRRGKVDVCVDLHEYPNRPGELPRTVADEEEAAARCKGQGKRLCQRAEWERACSGPRNLLFPYGAVHQQGLCQTASAAGARSAVAASGAHPGCRSAYGILDLSGNLAEWVQGGALMGGSAAKPGHQTSCESDAGSGGTEFSGVRCCATPRP